MDKLVLDEKDAHIIDILIDDARTSLKQISDAVAMSPPSVADRIRRLEANGIVRGFSAQVDPVALGYALEAVVRIKPMPGRVQLVEQMIVATPEITQCDKITGDDCFVARISVRTIADIDRVLDRIGEKATTSTSIVKRKIVTPRLPPIR